MIKSIHHINFLVRDLDKHSAYFSTLLNQTADIAKLPQRHVTTARFLVGETHLVLVSPDSDQGEPARILKEQGEGLFLLSFSAMSLDETLDQLEKKGIMANSAARNGLLDWRVIDMDAPTELNTVIQICESSD